jgi:hypothetical protein
MTLTGSKVKPTLKGTLTQTGPWQALFAREGYRIYPYQLGCAVRSDSTGTAPLTYGMGDFITNDYLMRCIPTYYGDSFLYIPQTSSISRVTNDPSSETDDTLDLSQALTLVQEDYLLNLGADGASSPLSAPDFDGSRVTLYTDPAGVNTSPNPYLLTAQNGNFNGWVSNDYEVVDLLITNADGVPQLVWPHVTVGREIIVE